MTHREVPMSSQQSTPLADALREAIKRGLKQEYSGGRWEGDRMATFCALQAAITVVDPKDQKQMNHMRTHFQAAYNTPNTCPECGRYYTSSTGLIAICLNDRHHWSFKRIACWCEEKGF